MSFQRLSLIAAASLLTCAATAAFAQSTVIIPPSSSSTPADAGVRAHTNVQIMSIPSTTGIPAFGGPPYPGYFYEDPASLACVYDLVEPDLPGCNPNSNLRNPAGGSKAIAIVDAYDDPDAYNDLQTFSGQFGVAAITPTSFKVVYAPLGGATPGACTGKPLQPPTDPTGGWELEESLDIEYAHSMAPQAQLYLVEAQSDQLGDLLCAVTTANNLLKTTGGGEVSMSWGSAEFSQETIVDPVFTAPGVVYFASTGDAPGVSYPAASPNVVAVGGTSIGRNPGTGTFIAESNWQVAGGGPSAYEARPAYQKSVASIVGNSRGTPDISLNANPYTGVWVLDDFLPPAGCGAQCWYIVGGTSVSSPTFAGIVNAANNFASSSSAELTALYNSQPFSFNNIRIGSCGPYMGYLTTSAWDFCTGLGSPNGYPASRTPFSF